MLYIDSTKEQLEDTEILDLIESFVKYCKKNVDRFAGFNCKISKHKGCSYLLAKSEYDLQPSAALKFELDYAHPKDRPLIANAIYKAMYGRDMSPESMDRHIVTYGDVDELTEEDKPRNLH